MSILGSISPLQWAEAAVTTVVIGLVATALLMQHGQIQRLRVDVAAAQAARQADRAAYAGAAASAAAERLQETSRRVVK